MGCTGIAYKLHESRTWALCGRTGCGWKKNLLNCRKMMKNAKKMQKEQHMLAYVKNYL